MAACIATERVEMEMAIAGRKVGDAAFWIPEEDEAKAIVESTLREVCSMLGTAEEFLNPNGLPRSERASDVPPNREVDVDDVFVHAGAPAFSRAMQDNPPYREKAKVGELSFYRVNWACCRWIRGGSGHKVSVTLVTYLPGMDPA